MVSIIRALNWLFFVDGWLVYVDVDGWLVYVDADGWLVYVDGLVGLCK